MKRSRLWLPAPKDKLHLRRLWLARWTLQTIWSSKFLRRRVWVGSANKPLQISRRNFLKRSGFVAFLLVWKKNIHDVLEWTCFNTHRCRIWQCIFLRCDLKKTMPHFKDSYYFSKNVRPSRPDCRYWCDIVSKWRICWFVYFFLWWMHSHQKPNNKVHCTV